MALCPPPSPWARAPLPAQRPAFGYLVGCCRAETTRHGQITTTVNSITATAGCSALTCTRHRTPDGYPGYPNSRRGNNLLTQRRPQVHLGCDDEDELQVAALAPMLLSTSDVGSRAPESLGSGRRNLFVWESIPHHPVLTRRTFRNAVMLSDSQTIRRVRTGCEYPVPSFPRNHDNRNFAIVTEQPPNKKRDAHLASKYSKYRVLRVSTSYHNLLSSQTPSTK